MTTRKRTKIVREGKYVAEVDVGAAGRRDRMFALSILG